MDSENQKFFKDLVGDKRFLTESISHYGKDWTQGYESNPSAVIFPESSLEVSKILKYCNDHTIYVVASGGRTGLAAAAYATNQELVISMERMNKIISFDKNDASLVVEAGVITQVVQEEAIKNDLFFGVDLAAKGSSQIGGNIATNAGGTKFIKYGGMREQVLGIEVVLADGSILNLNNSLRKDNSGYDLKHLFIGSEGTLGVVTKATLKLWPKPKEKEVSLLALDSFDKVLNILNQCFKFGILPDAFEFISNNAMDKVTYANRKNPFDSPHPIYALVELESSNESQKCIESFFEKNLCIDGIIADSAEKKRELWSYREEITESIAETSFVHKNDVSLPIATLPKFYVFLESLEQNQVKIVTFGHVGDGNMHVNYTASKESDRSVFDKAVKKLESSVNQFVLDHNGSMSAEHGIGLLKKKLFNESRDELSLNMMKGIKNLFDRNGILNPGKVLTL